jgi:hypothetical protein
LSKPSEQHNDFEDGDDANELGGAVQADQLHQQTVAASMHNQRWTAVEEATIIRDHHLGHSWEDIAKLLPGRTIDAVRVRWGSRLRHRVDSNTDAPSTNCTPRTAEEEEAAVMSGQPLGSSDDGLPVSHGVSILEPVLPPGSLVQGSSAFDPFLSDDNDIAMQAVIAQQHRHQLQQQRQRQRQQYQQHLQQQHQQQYQQQLQQRPQQQYQHQQQHQQQQHQAVVREQHMLVPSQLQQQQQQQLLEEQQPEPPQQQYQQHEVPCVSAASAGTKKKYRGVYKVGKKFKAQIQTNWVGFYLGLFDCEEDAAKAINEHKLVSNE